MGEWTKRTVSIAIACGITSTVRGEMTSLKLVLDTSEVEAKIKSDYGFIPRDFSRSPILFPPTRSVVDLVAYLCQDMRIPHDLYEDFLAESVGAGVYNPKKPG